MDLDDSDIEILSNSEQIEEINPKIKSNRIKSPRQNAQDSPPRESNVISIQNNSPYTSSTISPSHLNNSLQNSNISPIRVHELDDSTSPGGIPLIDAPNDMGGLPISLSHYNIIESQLSRLDKRTFRYKCHLCTFSTNQARVFTRHLSREHPSEVTDVNKKMFRPRGRAPITANDYQLAFSDYQISPNPILTPKNLTPGGGVTFGEVLPPGNGGLTPGEDEITNSRGFENVEKIEKSISKNLSNENSPIQNPPALIPQILPQSSSNLSGGAHREKRFKCSICGAHVLSNAVLIVHMRTHTGERPFECDLCTARFARKACLKRHIKGVHLCEKPFNCPVCQRPFTHKHAMKKHLETTCKNSAKSLETISKLDGSESDIAGLVSF
jgi:KRAB domain-containing zinc finger protein